jgi:hypothetical protein
MDEQSRKVFLKIHQIARFRVRGHKDADIARHFGLSQGGFARLVGSSEYKEIEAQVLQTVLGRLDESAVNEITDLRLKFSAALPEAIKSLLDTVKQNRDLKARMEAVKEIFDRDPQKTFTKSSPSGGGPGVAPTLPGEVLASLDKDNEVVVNDFSKQASKMVQ